MFWVYILKCRDYSYYTGHTDNLDNRIFQHQNKLIPGCYTYTKLPVQLVYSQDFSTREEALTAEQQIKGWSRRKKKLLFVAIGWLYQIMLRELNSIESH
jgi:putative endonuclease